MEVSHLTQYDTHAVIGGGKAESFSMSASAEFFTVLSDTMYSNKKLAVVREVMCNAWDSHIVAGKKNVPIQVTITNDEMSIEDFGTGIPNDKIVGVYCVYGASTKAKDDNQTGGFGLGSKAPFAYSAHFTVANSIGGFTTIYAASRGSSETEGRPDFRAMARIPTTGTGIKVTIPLAKPEDAYLFKSLAGIIARNGNMNVVLNGDSIRKLDTTKAEKLGFLAVSPRSSLLFDLSNTISVRYGSVIYPLDAFNDGISAAYRRVIDLLPSGIKIVLFAPAGKICITPSRESLSYTEMTRKTINAMLSDVAKKITGECRIKGRAMCVAEAVKLIEECKEHIGTNVMHGNFWSALVAKVIPASRVDFDAAESVGAVVFIEKPDFQHEVTLSTLKKIKPLFPKYRAELRKVAAKVANPTAKKTSSRNYNCFNEAILFFDIAVRHRRARWIRKLITETGSAKHAIIANAFNSCPLNGSRYFNGGLRTTDVESKVIHIASTVGDIYSSIRGGFKSNNDYTSEAYLCFRVVKSGIKMRQRITDLAEKLGAKVVTQEPKKIERKPKPKVEFLSLAAFRTGGSFSKSTRIVEMEEIRKKFSVEKPAYYLYGVTRDSTVYMSDEHDFQYMMPLVHRLYPEAALATSAFVRDKMIAVGSKSVTEMMIEEVRKHIDNKAVQYGFFIENASCSHFYSALNVTGSALDWAKRDARIAQLFFPMRLVNAEKVNRIKDILRCLAVIKTDEVIKLKDDLSEKTKNLFSIQDFNKTILTKFPGISMMEKTTFENNKADPDALYETLVFMKKRGEKLAAAQKEK